ncbi:MAG TPA: iron chelate uptake ABC transporter family permease subunit [Phycisphaerae bacterium]|nr:iron chelate uptake ABC transporter family permease subunit [Phycisphaerae bacterium]
MRRVWTFILAAAVLTAGCDKTATVTTSPARAERIVTFSPALTAIAFDMGLGDHVVGVTRFCQLPEGVQRKEVGDASSINAGLILSVRPDVIFAQTDEGKFQGVRDIDPNVRIVSLEMERLADVLKAIDQLGGAVGREDLADRAKARFLADIEAIRASVGGRDRPRVLFVMGTDRPFVAGRGTFVGDLIEAAGGVNAGSDIPGYTRWLRTQIDDIAKARPDVILCHTAPGQSAAAGEYWLQWKDLPAARQGRVFVLTDPAWQWPSTRLAPLGRQLAAMLHPETASAPATGGRAERSGDGPTMTLALAWMYRLIAAAIVGAALAAAGMALQGLLRNPLAEPYVLGISSGAGVGVLLGLAVAARVAVPEWLSTPVLAFAGALITCAAVYAIAQRRGVLDPYSLILAGVIINSFNGAIMLTIYLYVDPARIADFAHWAMGRLPDSVDRSLLIVCGACVTAGWAVLLRSGSAFNVLGLGDEVARSSGVSVARLRLTTFLCVGVMTAAAVALAGPIAFVGLIVPHVCRMVAGADHRVGVVVSGAAGAVFLVGAEVLCRVAGPLIGVSLIPVGILTALSGGPFFIYLLRRKFGEGRS